MRGAELVKEGVADIEAVEDALGAQIAVGQDAGRPILAMIAGPAVADHFDGFVPADALELSASLSGRSA